MEVEFIEVKDAWGSTIPIARPLAMQAAATGQAVAVWLTADACRAALAGRLADPGVVDDAPRISTTDRDILRALSKALGPLKGPEIGERIHRSESTVKERMANSMPLKLLGLVKNKRGSGYEITPAGREGLKGRLSSKPTHIPHPLDVLVIALLEEGAKSRAVLCGGLEGEDYPSGGRTIAASASNIKKRVDAMAAAGVIQSTAAGYVIADDDAVARLNAIEFGGCGRDKAPPPADPAMRRALRRLRRGDATTAQLAGAADRTGKTISNWVAEDGPLYAYGVRRVRKGVYTWPTPIDIALDD